jgi:hypothetical protein
LGISLINIGSNTSFDWLICSSHKLKQCIFIVMSTDKKILLSLYGELDHCMEMGILSGYDCLNLSIFSHNFVPYVVMGDISPFKDSFSYHYVI